MAQRQCQHSSPWLGLLFAPFQSHCVRGIAAASPPSRACRVHGPRSMAKAAALPATLHSAELSQPQICTPLRPCSSPYSFPVCWEGLTIKGNATSCVRRSMGSTLRWLAERWPSLLASHGSSRSRTGTRGGAGPHAQGTQLKALGHRQLPNGGCFLLLQNHSNAHTCSPPILAVFSNQVKSNPYFF